MKKAKVGDGVNRVTTEEALTFEKLDLEIRLQLERVKSSELELQLLHQAYLLKKAELENNKIGFQRQAQMLQPKYMEFTKGLAERYHVDLQKMVIDPESRVIREP